MTISHKRVTGVGNLVDKVAPGVYVYEVSGGNRPINAVGTRTAGFVGQAPKSSANIAPDKMEAMPIYNWTEFQDHFLKKDAKTNLPTITPAGWTNLAHAVYGFFVNGGSMCYIVDVGSSDDVDQLKAGLDLLDALNDIAIIAAPGFTKNEHHNTIRERCEKLKDRIGILDPENKTTSTDINTFAQNPVINRSDTGMISMYFPWLKISNPDKSARATTPTIAIPPSGHIAGIWARSDAQRGVHKAPANEVVEGIVGVAGNISNEQQVTLNKNGVNAIRYFANEGIKVWGARTLAPPSSEWRYLNVRRLFTMLEEAISEGTRWVVFEPNDSDLWRSVRRDVSAFLMDYWRSGALMGNTSEEAFFVKCDAENNPPKSIRDGKVVIDIGLAPTYPAEFVVFRIGQWEAGAEVELL